MKKASGLVSSFLILFSVLLAPNCATLTRQKTQGIPVTSSPAGATVIVNGIEQGVTPLEVRLARKRKGQLIRIESPGYNSIEIRLMRRVSGLPFLGNLLLGLIPGALPAGAWSMAYDGEGAGVIWIVSAVVFGQLLMAADSRGAGCELVPKELVVTLTKVDGTPRVDTMRIDADELQNVKWIRVRRD